MCELFCLSSRWPTHATFSLKAFAARGGVGSVSVDGWGLAFHDGRDVRLYREPEPADDSTWLAFIQARSVACNLVISHIRHATRGALTLANARLRAEGELHQLSRQPARPAARQPPSHPPEDRPRAEETRETPANR